MSVPLTIIIGDERGLTKGRVHQIIPGPICVPEGCFVAGIEWKAWASADELASARNKVTMENRASVK